MTLLLVELKLIWE